MDTSVHNAAGKKSGRTGLVIVLVVLCILALAVCYFVKKDPELPDKMSSRVGSAIGEMASEAGKHIPLPEPGSTGGNALPGAPAHKGEMADMGKTELPQEEGASLRAPLSSAENEIPEDVAGQEDSVVRVAFLDDLANWLRRGYSGRGQLKYNLQEANLRYGQGMRGLAWVGEDLSAGRSAALQHVFTRDMLAALYQQYADRFMESVAWSLDEGVNPFSPSRKNGFYLTYAQQFRAIAGVLQGIVALPDFTGHMNELHGSAQKVMQANARYSEILFDRDNARERGDNAAAQALQEKASEAGLAYQQAIMTREKTRDSLAWAIRGNGNARLLDNDAVLFLAEWIERRVHNDPDKMEAARQCVVIFSDLAERFEKAGAEVVRQEGN